MHIADRTDRRRQPQPNVMGIISRAPLLVLLVAGCSYVTGTLATEADKTSVPPLRVVAISGGTRGASCNSGLVRYVVSAAPSIAPRIEITVLDVSSWPLFNSDLISTVGVPADIKAGMSLVAHAHGVIIATPEYNWALAPGTTNAVAWLSQMSGRSSPVAPLASKPCGLLSAGGALGGSRAQLQARNSFTVFLNMPTMAKPEVAVRIFGDPTPFELVFTVRCSVGITNDKSIPFPFLRISSSSPARVDLCDMINFICSFVIPIFLSISIVAVNRGKLLSNSYWTTPASLFDLSRTSVSSQLFALLLPVPSPTCCSINLLSIELVEYSDRSWYSHVSSARGTRFSVLSPLHKQEIANGMLRST